MLNLLLTMIDAQSKFVASKIKSKKGRAIFLKTVEEIVARHKDIQPTPLAYHNFTYNFIDVESLVNKETSWLDRILINYSEYHKMATHMISDILTSIDTRFVYGGSKDNIKLLEDKFKKAQKVKAVSQGEQDAQKIKRRSAKKPTIQIES